MDAFLFVSFCITRLLLLLIPVFSTQFPFLLPKDVNEDGALSRDEFVAGYHKLKPDLTKDQLMRIFDECDVDDNGSLR